MNGRSPSLLAGLLLALGFGSACQGGVLLYEVDRTSVLECDIRPNGRFCGDPLPPSTQLFAVERNGSFTLVHFDQETWVAEGVEGERSVLKEERTTREPGPCTSTLQRRLEFDEDGKVFTGTLEITTRVEGPSACGDTPRGEHRVFSLTGARTTSI
jgi:hypothetical protein